MTQLTKALELINWIDGHDWLPLAEQDMITAFLDKNKEGNKKIPTNNDDGK